MNAQVCATIPQDLVFEIEKLAKRDSRTFSQTVSLLLQQAVKERNRKRKQVKDDLHNSN